MAMLMWEDDPSGVCAAGCLERYLEKLAPGQLRLFCKVKKNKREMSATQPIGRHTISRMIKEVGVCVGVENLDRFNCHSLRKGNITCLANDSSVSLKETMKSARHSSISASLAYQQTDPVSQKAKFMALMKNAKRSCGEDVKDGADDDLLGVKRPKLVKRDGGKAGGATKVVLKEKVEEKEEEEVKEKEEGACDDEKKTPAKVSISSESTKPAAEQVTTISERAPSPPKEGI